MWTARKSKSHSGTDRLRWCHDRPGGRRKSLDFREVVSYLENGTIPARPTNREKREMILRHAALQLEYKGEYTGVREMRKHLSWYTVGMPHSAHFRQTINTMEKMDELIRGVHEIFPDEV